ncbi:MAG TPA: radical SAM protein [Dongiaceae bacterium]|nr:radical SAM protein [Dongiaceae bacterium]
MKITEIFHSIQGESSQAGRPCVFVRLTACDLRCRWCDTEYAFTEGEPMAMDDVLARVRSVGCPLVEITGGEPLLQKETPELCRRLLEEGFEVMLETGGHRDISVVPEGVRIILDVKCPGSGETHKMHWENLERLPVSGEIKFVIADRFDYEWSRETVRGRDLAARHVVLFSPVFGELAYEDLASWILEDRLPVRFQMQQHKHIWDPERRGV